MSCLFSFEQNLDMFLNNLMQILQLYVSIHKTCVTFFTLRTKKIVWYKSQISNGIMFKDSHWWEKLLEERFMTLLSILKKTQPSLLKKVLLNYENAPFNTIKPVNFTGSGFYGSLIDYVEWCHFQQHFCTTV